MGYLCLFKHLLLLFFSLSLFFQSNIHFNEALKFDRLKVTISSCTMIITTHFHRTSFTFSALISLVIMFHRLPDDSYRYICKFHKGTGTHYLCYNTPPHQPSFHQW